MGLALDRWRMQAGAVDRLPETMIMLKKLLGTLFVAIAAPVLLGGPVACAKSCAQRCQDQNAACGISTDCTGNCTNACAKQNEALFVCVGTDCSCTSAGSADACTAFLETKCQAEYQAAVDCATGA